jgi:hypothetical protein
LNPVYTPSAADRTAGSVTLQLTADAKGTCADQMQTITLTITPAVAVHAGADAQTCQGTAINLSLRGAANIATASNYNTITWTGGTGTLSNANALNPTYTPGVGETGLVVLTLTATPNGSCSGSSDQVTIDVTPLALANAGADAETCQGVSFDFSTRLLSDQATAANYASLAWTTTGAGTIFNGNTLNPTYTPSAGETGLITFTLTATANGGCGVATNTMDLMITPAVVLSAGDDAAICQNALAQPFDFTSRVVDASGANASVYNWTASGGGSFNNPALINPIFTINAGFTGTITFTFTGTGSGSCASVVDNFTLVVKPQPVLAITNNTAATICHNSQTNFLLTDPTPSSVITLTNIAISGAAGNITGYTPVGTTFITGSTVADLLVNTTTAPQTITYSFQSTANGCVGPVETLVLTVQPSPVFATTNNDSDICEGTATNISITTATTGLRVTIASVTATGGVTGFTSGVQFNAFPATITQTLVNPTSAPQTVTYYLEGSIGGSCVNSVQQQVTVVVNPTPVVTSAASKNICSAQAVNYTPASDVAGASFTWTAALASGTVSGFTASGSGTITDILSNTTNVIGTVEYTITPHANGCSGSPFVLSVTVDPQPVISSVVTPLSQVICNTTGYSIDINSATVPSGAGVIVYSFTATGSAGISGFAASGSNVSTGTNITETSVVNSGLVRGTVSYTITPHITGSAVGATCNGNPITVIINVDPTPAVTSVNAKNICSAAAVNYTPTSNVSGTIFNWTASNTSGTVTGFATSGNGTITDILTNTTNTVGTVTYVITPVANGCSGAPFNVAVNVEPQPQITSIVTPISSVICNATGYSINVNSASVPTGAGVVVYDFTAVGTTGITGFVASGSGISIASDITETNVANAGTTQGFVTYTITPRITGSSVGSVCSGAPITVTITVDPTPAVTSASGKNICSGGAVNYSPASNVSGTSFNWTASVLSGTVAGFSASGSGTITNILTNSTNAVGVVRYVITPVANGCTGTSFNFDVTVDPRPVITTISSPASQIVCNNTGFVIDVNSLAVPAGSGVVVYDYVAVASAGSVTGFTASGTGVSLGTDISVGAIANSSTVRQTLTYTITPRITTSASGVDCPGTAVQVIINIDPTPAVSSVNNGLVCSKQSVNYLPTSTVPGTTYAWTASVTTGVVSGFAAAGTGNIMDVLVNTGNVDGVVRYIITPTANGCAGPAFNLDINVRPEPVMSTLLNGTVCSESPSTINFNTNGTSIGASSYTINSITVQSGLTPASGNATTGSLKTSSAIAADKYTNSTTGPLTATYSVTPVSALGCSGNPFDIVLTVSPEPAASNTLETSICSDVAFSFNPQNNITNGVLANYTWTASYAPGLTGGAASGTGAAAGTLTNVTNGIINAVYTVTPVSQTGTCTGNPFTITVPIRPEPVGVADVATVCSDVEVNYNLINNVAISGNNVGSTFSWLAVDNTSVTGESLTPQANGRITNIINNVTNASHSVVYSVTPTSASGCVGNAFAITVNVNPEPVGISSTHVICSDLAVSYDLQNNVNTSGNILPAVFNWSAGANPVVIGEGTLVKTASLIDDILANPSNAVENVLYTINPSAQGTGCLGNTFTMNVSVNPRAKISAGPDLELCQNFPGIALQGSINYAPNGITWTGGQGAYSSATNPNAVYSFKNPEEINTVFTLTMTATDPDGAGPCPIETDQMTLRINPLPIVVFTGLPSGAPPQMAENNLPITLTGNQVGGVFTISPITSNIGSTIVNPVDKAVFDPDAVDLGSNLITYTYTDAKGCVNSNTQEVIVNPITNVDFTIQGATLNADGQYEICAELGLVKLIGFPPASSGFGPETQFNSIPAFVGGPTANIVFDGTDYFIQTNNLVSQTYRIRYDYKNAFGAITFKIRDVKIFASPVATLTSANNCIASDVVFSDLSTINPTPFGTNIVSWQWDFDDNTTSAIQNPSKRYSTPDTYNVRLRVGTLQGCFDQSDVFPVRVGAVPVPDFKWSAICNSEFTKFEDISTNPGNVSTITDYSWNFGDGNILTGQAAQPVPAGTHSGTTAGVYEKPDHQYSAFNTYDVTLSVVTNDGCANTITKKVFILPYSTLELDANTDYLETFETSNGGWIQEAGLNLLNAPSDTSWVWGLPAGAHITSGANNSQRAWWTGANTNGKGISYFSNESSSVNGPCFDLTDLERPMVSIDYFADMDASDGAVLQFSTDGGNNWRNVGTESQTVEGINWFNGRGLLSNPGKQTFGQYGWTGNKDQSQGVWKTARFHLDMVPVASRKQVRLRVAFASNDGNPEGNYDGFAFDNFFVGNKKRTVLVENFTNTSSTIARNASQHFDALYAAQADSPDFLKIQYHMSVPAFDQLNRDNPSDPGARSFFYNVSSPPHTLMDGLVGNYYGKVLNGDHAQIDAIEIDRRALEDPEFMVDTAIFQTSPNDVLRAQVTFSPTKALPSSPIIFQVALVEDNINGNRNVLRKFLLQSEGMTVNRSWIATDVQTIDIDYPIDVPVVNPNNLYLVAFVQDKTTRRILQSRIFKAPVKVGITPVGIEDDPTTAEIRNISVYPNPASQRLNFFLENELTGNYGWHIVDQRGVTVLEGELNKDLSSPQQVSIGDIANGIYFVRFTRGDKTIVYRKIAVMNRN